MNYKEDDLILCTVKAIEGTTVFVETEDATKGTISLSEVSAGRIRNIREFVSAGKKIVCKVLRAQKDHVEVSLRRVTVKEREAVLDKYTKERTVKAMLKPILAEKTETIIKEISETYELSDFLDMVKEDPKVAEKFLTKAQIESLTKILKEKKEKERQTQKKIMLKTQSETGVTDIQKILATDKAEVSYLGSSLFSVTVKDKDIKAANARLNTIIEEIKERAKAHKALFDVKEA